MSKHLYQWSRGKDWVFINHEEEWIMTGCGYGILLSSIIAKDDTSYESFHEWCPADEVGETYSFKLPGEFFE